MSKLVTVSLMFKLNLFIAMLLLAALFGCHELASTFKVLTWRIMPDAGED
jgi:hypothetical protein